MGQPPPLATPHFALNGYTQWGCGIYWLWYLLEYSFYTVQYTLHNILLRDSDHGVANTPITYLPLPILPSLTSLEDVCQTPYAALPQAGTRAAPAPAHPAMFSRSNARRIVNICDNKWLATRQHQIDIMTSCIGKEACTCKAAMAMPIPKPTCT